MQANGAAIRAIRERSGLTQVQLADTTDIDRGNLNRIESGVRSGTPMQIIAIAAALKVPLTAIIRAVADETVMAEDPIVESAS